MLLKVPHKFPPPPLHGFKGVELDLELGIKSRVSWKSSKFRMNQMICDLKAEPVNWYECDVNM